MRNLCALLLVLAVQTLANAQGLPTVPLPPAPPLPPPPDLPNCATALIAIADDIYYYETVSCTTGTTGYGQSSYDCGSQYGCTGTTCNCIVQTVAATAGTGIVRNSPTLSDCKSLPAVPEDALAVIRKECDEVLKYLKKLLKSPRVSPSRKKIVEPWATYLERDLIPYLSATGGADYTPEAKLAYYCGKDDPKKAVPDSYLNSELAWRNVYIDLAGNRRTVLFDVPQKALRPESDINFEGKSGYTLTKTGIQRVTVNDVAGSGSKTVYFATFKITKTFRNGAFRYTYMGLQVEPPANPPTSDTATMTDGSSFAHVIKVGGAAYAVTTVDDLSI